MRVIQIVVLFCVLTVTGNAQDDARRDASIACELIRSVAYSSGYARSLQEIKVQEEFHRRFILGLPWRSFARVSNGLAYGTQERLDDLVRQINFAVSEPDIDSTLVDEIGILGDPDAHDRVVMESMRLYSLLVVEYSLSPFTSETQNREQLESALNLLPSRLSAGKDELANRNGTVQGFTLVKFTSVPLDCVVWSKKSGFLGSMFNRARIPGFTKNRRWLESGEYDFECQCSFLGAPKRVRNREIAGGTTTIDFGDF